MIARTAQERRAVDVVVMDMRPLMTVCDYFVIGHSRSRAHIDAITENIEEKMKQHQIRPHHREGRAEAGWVVLDYWGVVVHVFSEEARRFYNLEHLWADAPVITPDNGSVTADKATRTVDNNSKTMGDTYSCG